PPAAVLGSVLDGTNPRLECFVDVRSCRDVFLRVRHRCLPDASRVVRQAAQGLFLTERTQGVEAATAVWGLRLSGSRASVRMIVFLRAGKKKPRRNLRGSAFSTFFVTWVFAISGMIVRNLFIRDQMDLGHCHHNPELQELFEYQVSMRLKR